MKKKRLFMVLASTCLILAMAVTACAEPTPAPAPAPAPAPTPAPAPAPTPAGPITLRVGWDAPPMESFAKGIQLWADLVTERTEGSVVVETYPAQALGTDETAVEMLLGGVADGYMLSTQTQPEYFPLSHMHTLPGFASFPETEEGLVDYISAIESFFSEPAVADEWKDFKIIGIFTGGSNNFLSHNKPVRTPEDLDGMKVGGATGVKSELMEEFGAVPVPAGPPPLLYQSFQSGLIEGATNPWDLVFTFQLWEVLEYVSDIPFGGGAGLTLPLSLNAWNKVSAGDQQIMLDTFPEARELATKEAVKLITGGRQGFLDYRGEDALIIPTPAEKEQWEEAFMAFYYDKWFPEQKAAGVTNVEELFNMWKSISDKAMAKYEK